MSSLLSSLNPEQRRAVETTEGPLLVLAGAGTGKTRVITYRIAHILAKGTPPGAVLAVTFTNKAAQEMRERLAGLVGKEAAGELFAGTFHSFCLGLLRANADRLGYPEGFTLCDAADQLALFKRVLRELHVAEAAMPPAVLQARVSLLKNRNLDPETCLARAGDPQDELVARAWQRYQERLATSRRLDFDDLLIEAVRLLDAHADLLETLRERYRYVLVDEYQDTNGVQYELVRRLAGPRGNVCVVGDDDQSIYSWRGADIQKILGFERDFPGAAVVTLETNYRSTRDILTLANRLIAHNTGRHEKTLRSHIGSGELVQAVAMRDENIEAETVVREISEAVAAGKASHRDFAILFRTATQPRAFEAELRMKQIPYVLVGGMSFFDRKEVRDVLAYLRLVANPLDESSFLRVVNTPPRGIGKTTLEKALALATERGISVVGVFSQGDPAGIRPEAVDVVRRLRERLEALHDYHTEHGLVALVHRLLEEFAYRKEIERLYPDAADQQKRWAAVEEVANYAENYERRRKRPTLGGFLNELTLTASDTQDRAEHSRDAVTLMTLHASKGLEFPRVYLVGLEESLLPHGRAVLEGGVEEERRLAYVGLTRARQSLTLTYCLERAKFGTRVKSHPSRFLFEIKGTPPPEDWVPAAAEAGANRRHAAKKKRKASKRGSRRRARR